jgi:hypothetical protein
MVFDTARLTVLGDAAPTIRGVIVSRGESIFLTQFHKT